ncbi:MAG: hypothetical protein FK730_13645 [Asgard group archaeon]|nr:hypothetical protein [Asgard group archaeon]
MLKQINISQISAFFANGSYPIEFLFYYPNRINTKKLHRALKKISTRFWPVFGIYADGIITESNYSRDIHFNESSVNEIFDPATDYNTLRKKIDNITPELISRLFFLKVIHYNNGTVLIPKMNHLVGDGYSYFYLLTVLAAVTKREGIPFAPSIITTAFRPKFDSTLGTPFHFTDKPPKTIAFDNDLEVELIELSQTEIRNQASNASEKSGMRISSNDILSAMIVKIILKNSKKDPPKNFRLVIPIDVRRGVAELGQRFFGNGLVLYNIPFHQEEVNKSSVDELAIKIRKSFPEVNRRNYEDFLKKIDGWIETGQLEHLRPYDPINECLVTNLSRMPIAKLDFGSEPPTTTIPLTSGRSGAAILVQKGKFILRFVR